MSSTALYKAFIEVGASQEAATEAAEDVIQVSQLPQLATKVDIAVLKTDIEAVKSEIALLRSEVVAEIGSLRSDAAVDIANMETRLLKWMVGCGFLFAGVVIAGVGIVIQIMLSPGVAQ